MRAMSLSLPPLSLYVHLPWCVRKCPYCDFNSHEARAIPERDYLKALLEDIEEDLPLIQGRPLSTIFFGGGTPSLMSADFYHRLLEALSRKLPLAPDIEITLEANPGTVEQERFAGYRRAGINRLSIGVQSFDAAQLRALGRIHGPDEALAAVEMARSAGFDNLNLDLMHGLPGQTPAAAMADLERALALAPDHLSWYELTIEPNTAFFKAPPEQPGEDTMGDIEDAGLALLAQRGFRRYEVSAFARGQRECRHNRNYWEFGDYLAVGAGGHGKITLPRDDAILRYQKTRQPSHYLAGHGSRTSQSRRLTESERPLEFFLNALRLVDGVPADLFARRTGLDMAGQAERLERLRNLALMSADPETLACTPMGLRHLNRVLAEFDH